eukprot:g4535.t1
MKRSRPREQWHHLVAGMGGGAATTVVLHPLDVVKTRFQVHEGRGVSKSIVPRYPSTIAALRSIYRGEGVRSLYQGWTPAVTGSGMSWGLYFFFYEQAKTRARAGRDASERLSSVDILLCSCQAGAMTVMLTNPVWLVKTRMQLQVARSERIRLGLPETSSRHYKGLVHALREIVRNEGPQGLYRGIVPALLLVSHGALQFVAYEKLKEIATDSGRREMAIWQPLFLGAMSKIFASTTTYPYQVIKSRLQRHLLDGEEPYKGTLDCARRILANEGWRGFYKGLAPNCMRIAPSAALTFFLYEAIVRCL